MAGLFYKPCRNALWKSSKRSWCSGGRACHAEVRRRRVGRDFAGGTYFACPTLTSALCQLYLPSSSERNWPPPAACVLLINLWNMSAPLRILVVEDEKAVAHMIAMVLGGPASKVATARNGWEALIKIGSCARPFDLVITDHRMPRMTGLELVRRLRAQNFAGKILVVSGYLSDEDIRAYEEQSVDMMMSKPFDFDELQQAMAVLNRKASVLAEA